MEFKAKAVCQICGAEIEISAPSQESLNRKRVKIKYCPDCAYKKKREQCNAARRKSLIAKNDMVMPDILTKKEFDEGYRKFWEKRGLTPEEVEKYGI